MNTPIDPHNREIIEREFNRIIREIVNGKIYGESIEPYDLKALIVAAYYFGYSNGDFSQRAFYDIEEE